MHVLLCTLLKSASLCLCKHWGKHVLQSQLVYPITGFKTYLRRKGQALTYLAIASQFHQPGVSRADTRIFCPLFLHWRQEERGVPFPSVSCRTPFCSRVVTKWKRSEGCQQQHPKICTVTVLLGPDYMLHAAASWSSVAVCSHGRWQVHF